jgi:hypothetical protein
MTLNYVEEFIELFNRIRLGRFDVQLASSLAIQCMSNVSLTQKQSFVAIRLLKKYRSQIINLGYTNLDEMIENPKFRNPLRIIDHTKRVEINKEKNSFSISFPFDQEMVNKIREQSNKSSGLIKSLWDAEEKKWLIDINEESLKFIRDVLLLKDFQIQDEIKNFLNDMAIIEDQFYDHIPCLIKNEEKYVIKNLQETMKFDSIKDAVIACIKMSVNVYHEDIENDIQELKKENPFFSVIDNSHKRTFYANKNKFNFLSLLSFIKTLDLQVAIFVNDDHNVNELDDLYSSLINSDISNEEIAIYYRKPNDIKDFIDYNKRIKELKLNKQSEDKKVKWSILSTKFPKSLIKNNKQPDVCILLDRYVSTHHTVLNSIKNSMFCFYYNDHCPTGDNIVHL